MSDIFQINAQPRSDKGKGASRRLRRQGLVPGIVYGAHRDPESISLVHHELAHQLETEAFYSHILNLKLGEKTEKVVLKDMQRHPSKPFITHVDLFRVSAKEKLRINVPLHFLHEESCVGVKAGGVLSRSITDVEVSCLPADLPEYIEVDVASLDIGDSITLSGVVLPAGVELTALSGGADDIPVVSVHAIQVEREEGEEAEAGEEIAAVRDKGAATDSTEE
ncbi:MAG: 50S ribosomal protein L25/general stress protein Ctc [Chromatiaceae bacterium]|nr:50S ribosomal protein L25/general stress protein Ctc [Gammaproteobacteria bacterium]MCP5426986.1 50S ribosomal protein L25/general stress protein Ctc [Chromatiaceae bacterium]MCB1862256.1 50S ribosomal protein L25/general stress protein Ctc [Gammaproteobacteria bacterium]MCB1870960.1 50S ribosomal protein L25/general stress protein Ctc [Gammaproteobacteria bacterium]MCB1880817.1 50S ribosomal protein L25/general stress protein Ctc [Gammaproteobacteria bacterium]